MKHSKVLVVMTVALAFVFAAAGLYAAASPDVIKMNSAGYAKHTKPIVSFAHKKHVTAYGAKCSDCHHDKAGKPLAAMKEGDSAQKCIVCHKTPGIAPPASLKGLTGPARTKAEVMYQASAMHLNCQGCHKEWNKKNGKKPNEGAPVACNKCHK